jgi:hypothetical protein
MPPVTRADSDHISLFMSEERSWSRLNQAAGSARRLLPASLSHVNRKYLHRRSRNE